MSTETRDNDQGAGGANAAAVGQRTDRHQPTTHGARVPDMTRYFGTPVENPDARTVPDGGDEYSSGADQVQLLNDQSRLLNQGLPEADRGHFCDQRPEVAKPFRGIWEDFLNWARSESIWILGFGTGCGAIELRPLMTARFDMYQYGVQARPTPRQSGLFIIGGYASVKTMKRIVRSYEQMQGPKFVLGLGSCTINGGMYWDSYNTVNRLDHYIPVDVYVTGCMPRPEALLAGIMRLKEIIRAGKGEGANIYAEHFAWYKANQKRIIKDWNMPDYNW
jgi:NADH-quinone oxidoreductase subunit B